MKKMFKLEKDIHFLKVPFLTEFSIQLSARLKNYVSESCQNKSRLPKS